MELIDMYNNVQNPIANDEDIAKIVTAYCNTKGNFYNKIVNISNRDAGGKINEKDRTYFFLNNFNTWRESVLKLSKSQVACI